MLRKAVSGIVLMLLLTSMLTLALPKGSVHATSTRYIAIDVTRLYSYTPSFSRIISALKAEGYTVHVWWDGEITATRLADYCVLIIVWPQAAYGSSEVTAILDFVSSGGGLLFLGDYGKNWYSLSGGVYPVGADPIIGPLGVSINNDLLYDPSNYEGITGWPKIHTFPVANPITDGISIFMPAGTATLVVNSPATTIATGDDDTYAVDPDGPDPEGDSPEEGTDGSGSWELVLAASTYDLGRAVVAGDHNWIADGWCDYHDNIPLLVNVVKWFSAPPPMLKFLTLPFRDADIKVQQGWIYTFDPDPDAHKGIDYIKGEIDQPPWQSFDVVAAADGVAMQSSGGGYGTFVYIRHDEKDGTGNNYFTLYAHLDSVTTGIVSKPRGDTDYSTWTPVKRGGIIGRAGSTGVTDPTWIHLHFEVQIGGYPYGKTDPYDLYTTRDFYPGGSNYAGCGPNHLWTNDPPRTVIAQLITQEAIGAFPVTVDGQFYFVLTLKSYIDPITLEVVPNVMTKVYVEVAENYPVSDPEIARKIGLIDFARNWQQGVGSPESIAQKYSEVNNRWLIHQQIEYEDAMTEAIPTGLIGLLVDLVVGIIKEEVSDPMTELRDTTADMGVSEALDNYLSALKIAGDEITDYEVARTYLEHYWMGEAYERAAFFLLDEINEILKSKVDRIWDYLKKVVLGDISFSLSAFVELVLEGKRAMDLEWEYYDRRDIELRRVQELLSKLYGASAYTLELAQSPRIAAEVGSPVELRVYDSQERVTGVVNGEEKNEIPYSTYYEDTVTIFFPTDYYRYEIAGTDQGTYRLTVTYITDGETITQTYAGEIVEGAVYVYNVGIADGVMTTNPDPVAELDHLKEFIDGLRDDSFDKPKLASQRKNALFNKIDEVILKVEAGNYTDVINKLFHDIRAKMDDDSTAEDWIIDPEMQIKLCVIIDHIISNIKTLQEETG